MRKKGGSGGTHGRGWSAVLSSSHGSIIVYLCIYILLHAYRHARDAADSPKISQLVKILQLSEFGNSIDQIYGEHAI